MAKIINYDFKVETLVTVEAPAGTDPAMLEAKALAKLAAQAAQEQIDISFWLTFDPETGDYSEEWEGDYEEAN